MNRDELLKKVKEELPLSPGVYIMKNNHDEVIYVGKAKALKRRVKSYFDDTPKTPKTYALVSNIDHFDYILTNSELDAFSLESNLIKKFKPKYNILLKDDKSFPYLKIDLNERYPRVQIARHPKQETNVLYFGPYITGTRITELLNLIKTAYPIRWCNFSFDKKPRLKKPCLHGEIGNCLAPCISVENEEKYKLVIDDVIEFLNGKTLKIKKELKQKMDKLSSELNFEDALLVRNQIQSLENMDSELITNFSNENNFDVIKLEEDDEIFAVNLMMIRQGKNSGQVNFLLEDAVGSKKELVLSFISNYYKNESMLPKELVLDDIEDEDVELLREFFLSRFSKTVKITIPKIGTKVELLENCSKNAKEFLSHSKKRIENNKRLTIDALEGLKKLLNLKEKPNRIEGYDISNLGGKFSVGSMVVFENGKPAPKEYRKFKIKTVEGANDYASIAEVLSRRFNDYSTGKTNFSKKPDLLLIDGGFGQLEIAKNVLDKFALEIPVISLAEREEEICTLNSRETIKLKKTDYILKLLQRVRDESHRFAIIFHRNLRGKSIKSSLLEIDGLGENKVKELLKHFNSVDDVMKASVLELKQVQGIGEELANTIYNFYHKI